MDAFRKFVAERRSRFSSTAIRHDGDDDDIFCYHQQDDSATGRGGIALSRPTNNDSRKKALSLSATVATAAANPKTSSFGLQRGPPAPVYTSSEFENDERFIMVANSILCSFEKENMPKREAIETMLSTTDKQLSFLESIDSRYSATSNYTGLDYTAGTTTDDITVVLSRTRSIFYSTLLSMWQEANDDSNNTTSNSHNNNNHESSPCDQLDSNEEEQLRTGPPSSVSHYNNISSPIECTPRATSLCRATEDCSHQKSALQENQSRKRTKWFFDDPSERVRKSISEMAVMSSVATVGGRKNHQFSTRRLNVGPSRFHFDFTLPLPSSGAKRVESLQLDNDDDPGHHYKPAISSSLGRATTMYRPPTSPISGEFSMDRSIK